MNGIFLGIACSTALVFVALLYARQQWIEQLKDQVRMRMSNDNVSLQKIVGVVGIATDQKISSVELGAYASLTVAEFAWSWANIDHNLIKAADFSSTATVRNGLDFVNYIHSSFRGLSDSAQQGFFSRMMGYIGEQHLAEHLLEQGHTVEMATSSIQPDWDLVVDGREVNVKTVYDLATIKSDALAHPDIKYLVPEDAVGYAGHNVERVAGFKHEAIKESLKSGILASTGEHTLSNLMHHIPWVTVAFASVRAYRSVQLGKSLTIAAKHFAVETVGRGAGLLVGAKGGALIGAFAGPFGVAAGGFLGGLVGAMVGGNVAENIKRKPLRGELNKLSEALNNFGESVVKDMPKVRRRLYAAYNQMIETQKIITCRVNMRKKTIRWLFLPDYYTILLEESCQSGIRSAEQYLQKCKRFDRLVDNANDSGDYRGLGLLIVNSPNIHNLLQIDPAIRKSVMKARDKVFHERKQLDPTFAPPMI